MTSQQSTERTEKTDTRRRSAVRRGLKKRGVLPSFGDIVLPVVSILAVGLLVLAGRQFFINGIKTSPGVTSTRAYADSPAIMAELEQAEKAEKDSPSTEKSQAVSIPVVEEVKVSPPVEEVKKPVVVQQPKPAAPKPTPPKPAPAKPAQAKPAPAKRTVSQPQAKASSLPMNKQWRVQIGAYTSKSGAEEAAKKLRKAGYKAEVYRNPSSKHVKVWVAGGASKAQAQKVVEAMKKMGYKSSFAFPPAK